MQHEELLVCYPEHWSRLVKAIIDWIPKQLFSTSLKSRSPKVNRTRLCGQHKKPPCRILSFKRSGAATAVPLPFLFGCVRGYRSKYTCRSVRLLLGASLACGGRCTLFSEWRRNFLPWHCHKDFLSLTWTALCRKIVLAWTYFCDSTRMWRCFGTPSNHEWYKRFIPNFICSIKT